VSLRYIKNARTTSAMTSIKMVVFLLRLATGQKYYLPVIRAAWSGCHLRVIGSGCFFGSGHPFRSGSTTGVMSMTAARTCFLVMVRMDILACGATDDCRDKCFPASAACVHIKAYDTQRVPYHQQYRCQACEEILHTDLQRYKIPAIFQNALCRP